VTKMTQLGSRVFEGRAAPGLFFKLLFLLGKISRIFFFFRGFGEVKGMGLALLEHRDEPSKNDQQDVGVERNRVALGSRGHPSNSSFACS
jgi:hypothetical protein